jgi:hypothetical protein
VDWLKRLFRRGEDERVANRQAADTTGLVRENDPRGGMSAEAYNTADPREIVEEGGVAMSGPGGAPQEETTPDERRADQRE